MQGTIGAAVLALALTACGGAQQPLPQAPSSSSDTSTSQEAPSDTTTPEDEDTQDTTYSSCDIVREAILTGTKAQIKAAMKKLQADKTADATAREYARYYLVRDADEPDMQEMDVSLIQMSCTL
jgi:hypothetical protein